MHPLAPDLSKLTNDELMAKYNDLTKKFLAAHRFGSGSVVNQMSILLEDYRSELRRRQDQIMRDLDKNSNFKNIIDIK